jgi:glycosyltransferase involved in cell wall biosynthesis
MRRVRTVFCAFRGPCAQLVIARLFCLPEPACAQDVKGGPLLHRGRVRRHGGVVVVYAPAFNLFGLNILTRPFLQLLLVIRLMRRSVAGAIVYNFNPGLVILTAWLALTSDLRIIHDVEDVSVPTRSDWSYRSEARPIQQLVFWISMHLIARMSDGYIVPTRRFLRFLPTRPRVAVITGCIDVPSESPVARSATTSSEKPLRVLFAGKIAGEHGIVQFVEALVLLDATPTAVRLRVDITGTGPMSGWVTERLQELRTLKVVQHGFVSGTIYRALLADAHVCLALQDPQGRFADYKTPSKIYEFLGHAKAVIATDVGDIRAIPDDALIVLDALTSDSIAAHLVVLAQDPQRVALLEANAHCHAITNFSFAEVGWHLGQILRRSDT